MIYLASLLLATWGQLLPNATALAVALLGAVLLFGAAGRLQGEAGFMRLLEQEGTDFSASAARTIRMAPPRGLIRGISFEIRATATTGPPSALVDDSPWTLISDISVVFPLKRGDVTIRSTGRDLFILSRYLTGRLRENTTAASTAAFFAEFFLPFGPDGWGIHSDALRPNSEIVVKVTWGPVTEYGAGTTGITNGELIPTLHVDADAPPDANRMALIPSTTRLAVESESRFPNKRLNKSELAAGLMGVLYRQEDASAAADRVDGLVTRLQLFHSARGMLHDQHFRTLRQSGIEFAGIDPAQVTAALPLGLDGTAFYVAAPRLANGPEIQAGELMLTYDAAEAVPPQVTNVTPAAGDALHATVVSTIFPGA